ncbi:MAG: hypothetical protein IT480_07820 [Gammaproteobacteria bacterium]|nr:hypothetical protein [Gammaproteobacteria bacterium]
MPGRRPFPDPRDPPAYRQLSEREQALYDLGHAVFNTHWVPAGTAGAARRDGIGPLFNSESCDSCHNEGARGRGPFGDGTAPGSLVFQLATPGESDGGTQGLNSGYGHILNVEAIDGQSPEAVVTIRYSERAGRYADGSNWRLRVPSYDVSDLRYGPLSPLTVLKPRMAPAVFGAGLLDAVPQSAILQGKGTPVWHSYRGERVLGRFGWEAGAVSLRDQTTKALSREMGLGSSDIPVDDCTAAQPGCQALRGGDDTEVQENLLAALLEFQRWLAVPRAAKNAADDRQGGMLFAAIGCARCHRPSLPVVLGDANGRRFRRTIAPFTDLLTHDMGAGLADVDLSGQTVPTRFRTAPLWGVAHTARAGIRPTLLHDGRARSVEEAILWHDGEARGARESYMQLPAAKRQHLLEWVETR